ncbi:MAG: DUF2147 domain-containing protein [Crocinitomicaceae bacterium]
MKKLLLFLSVVSSLAAICQVSENDILGVWMTELKDGKIEIYKKNNLYFGKIVWIAKPNDESGNPILDSKNPDNSLNNRPLMGIDIISKMTFTGKEWSGGEIYDPKSGDTYTCKLWFENGLLKVRGYLGWLFDTKTWTKVS